MSFLQIRYWFHNILLICCGSLKNHVREVYCKVRRANRSEKYTWLFLPLSWTWTEEKTLCIQQILRCIHFVLPAPPAPAAYAPSMGLPDIMPPNPYVAPDPCNPCNTCAQCSLQVCSPCAQTCQPLSCPPRIPAKLQPLWQQWNERTAGNSFFLYMMYVVFH